MKARDQLHTNTFGTNYSNQTQKQDKSYKEGAVCSFHNMHLLYNLVQ